MQKIDSDRVLEVLAASDKPLGVGELLNQLGASPAQRTELKRVMRELVRDERALKDGKRFRVEGAVRAEAVPQADGGRVTTEPPLLNLPSRGRGRFVLGALRRHPEGHGFVEPITGGKGGIYLPAEDARRALDGDLVKIEVVPGFRGKPAGRFVEVVERRRTRFVGTLEKHGQSWLVRPNDAALGELVPVAATRRAKAGDLVKVQIVEGPSRRSGPTGEVLEAIGAPGDPIAEVLEAAYRRGFSDEFPADVAAQARAAQESVPQAEIARRRDLRSLPLVTIDGEDARDFDDAVYVERAKAGWRLVVAIADVAHYVREGTVLDFEALRRGTSVYFPSFALPMLPERLSNGICSLKPGEERLCLVADLVFERRGSAVRLVDAEIYEGVMKSAARCTYTEVAEVLSGTVVPHREAFRSQFALMEELARHLIVTRAERGSIDFDLPEAKIILDERHRPVRIERRARNMAHRLVEEFMLAANEAVATHFDARELPTVYRVHGEPDEEKLGDFLMLSRAHGFALEPGEEISGRSLNALLKKIAGSPEQRTLNYLLLRSMMQAVYSSQNIGHFGLAAPLYLHFTSPIRRYPDLIVHRLLKEHWRRGAHRLPEKEAEALEERLDGVAARSSERERAAMGAEREVDSYFAALFLKERVGEELEGIVAAVTPFGLFVELKQASVEGLVRSDTIGPGGWFDEKRHRLAFPNGPTFSLGTEVRIRVARVNLERRHVDFELLAVEGKPFRPIVAPGPQPLERPKGQGRGRGGESKGARRDQTRQPRRRRKR